MHHYHTSTDINDATMSKFSEFKTALNKKNKNQNKLDELAPFVKRVSSSHGFVSTAKSAAFTFIKAITTIEIQKNSSGHLSAYVRSMRKPCNTYKTTPLLLRCISVSFLLYFAGDYFK